MVRRRLSTGLGLLLAMALGWLSASAVAQTDSGSPSPTETTQGTPPPTDSTPTDTTETEPTDTAQTPPPTDTTQTETTGTVPEPAEPEPGPRDLWVDRANQACSDAFTREQASSPDTPWCSVIRAGAAAMAGDTVHVKPGRYPGTVRASSSGTSDAPIRYLGEGSQAVLDADGAAAAVKLVSVSDVVLEGLTITGATSQGVWADGGQRIRLEDLTVKDNPGHGIQLLRSKDVTVTASAIRDNGRAGIFEGSATSGGRYVDNEITGNGTDDDPYNGDGIQLGGTGARVAGSTITGNGTPGPYEHGIYAGPAARDYVIEANVVGGNAGSNVKAAGAGGLVRYNRLENGRLGLVVSDNPSPVVAYYNLVFGRYQHAVFLTADKTAAQARLWNNTIVVTGRAGGSGDASAVFVKTAALLDLRNNLISYANSDNLGAALYVVNGGQVSQLASNNNWFSTWDSGGRHLVRNGTRLTLAKWRKATGQDAKSIASTPPQIDGDARVTSANLGIDRGQPLGLARDYAGRQVDGSPDLGAYQS